MREAEEIIFGLVWLFLAAGAKLPQRAPTCLVRHNANETARD
jgi:hypothetical protein